MNKIDVETVKILSIPGGNQGRYSLAHLVAGVDQKVERARLVDEGQEGDAAHDLPDDVLDLLRDGLLGLARLLLDAVTVVVVVVVVVVVPYV